MALFLVQKFLAAVLKKRRRQLAFGSWRKELGNRHLAFGNRKRQRQDKGRCIFLRLFV
jgi:hypothetical protein